MLLRRNNHQLSLFDGKGRSCGNISEYIHIYSPEIHILFSEIFPFLPAQGQLDIPDRNRNNEGLNMFIVSIFRLLNIQIHL